MNVRIRVIGQRLSFNSNAVRIVSGSKNFVKFIFSYTSDWEPLSKYAQFVQGDSSYVVEIESDNTCYLPDSITDGDFVLSLYGVGGDDEDIIATTTTLTFNILKSNYIESVSEEVTV